MKKNIYLIICFLTGMMIMSMSCNNTNNQQTESRNEPSLENKKVLYVYGGWDGHDPKQCHDLFVPWLKSEGAEVFVYDNLSCYDDSTLMGSVDLIIQHFTQGDITAQQEKALLNAIRSGIGLAGWHGGTGDSFRSNVEYQYMVGGQWVAHPGNIIQYDVQITDHNDPVTAQLSNFSMESEQYYMHVDPNVKVLATTTFSSMHNDWIGGAVIPVVWKKSYGKGRVFYSSLGHVIKDFEVPEVLEIMQRGIRWAAQSKNEGPEKWVSPVYPSK